MQSLLILILISQVSFAFFGGIKQSGQFSKIEDELYLNAKQYKKLEDVSHKEFRELIEKNPQVANCRLHYIEQNGQDGIGMVDQSHSLFASVENLIGYVEDVDLSQLNVYGTGAVRFVDFPNDKKIEFEAPNGTAKVVLRKIGEAAKKRTVNINGRELLEYHLWQDIRQEAYLSADFLNALSGELNIEEDDCDSCSNSNGFMRGLKSVGGFISAKTINGLNRITNLLSGSQRNRLRLYVNPVTNEIVEFDEKIIATVSSKFARDVLYKRIGGAFVPDGQKLVELEDEMVLAKTKCSKLN